MTLCRIFGFHCTNGAQLPRVELDEGERGYALVLTNPSSSRVRMRSQLVRQGEIERRPTLSFVGTSARVDIELRAVYSWAIEVYEVEGARMWPHPILLVGSFVLSPPIVDERIEQVSELEGNVLH